LTWYLDSFIIVFLEHLIAALVLLPHLWFHRRKWLRLRAAEWASVIGIAWGGSALATLLFTEAVRSGNPTTAVLLQKSQPMIAALLAGLFVSEPLGFGFWTRPAVAVGGAYLISFGAHAPTTTASGAASLLALGAAALWAASTVLGRYMLRNVSAPTLTALRLTAALPVLMVAVWWQDPEFHVGLGPRQMLWWRCWQWSPEYPLS
jgi:drug/metabolite transporter (DMT)-like permease